MVFTPSIDLLSHSAPSAPGYLVATTAVPVEQLADALHKRLDRKEADDLRP